MKSKKCSSCSEIKYLEFPDLLFGKAEDGLYYFDPFIFIKSKGDIKRHSVLEFERAYYHWLKAVSVVYSIKMEEIIVKDDTTGKVIIEESLALPFVSYIDPYFAIHLLEKMSELLMCGISLSDTYINMHIKAKFSPEELSKFIDSV